MCFDSVLSLWLFICAGCLDISTVSSAVLDFEYMGPRPEATSVSPLNGSGGKGPRPPTVATRSLR